MNDTKIKIKLDTPVEEMAGMYPKAVSFLTARQLRCVRCGEPLWCTVGELFEQEGIENPVQLLDDLNNFIEKEYG